MEKGRYKIVYKDDKDFSRIKTVEILDIEQGLVHFLTDFGVQEWVNINRIVRIEKVDNSNNLSNNLKNKNDARDTSLACKNIPTPALL